MAAKNCQNGEQMDNVEIGSFQTFSHESQEFKND